MNAKNNAVPKLRFPGFTDAWEQRKLGDLLQYEQPTNYLVESTDYGDSFKTPVLTAGKSFILGYTSELSGIKQASKLDPIIIFDDFTTSSHYVDFPFKIKSSAIKLLSLKERDDNYNFIFNILKNINYIPQSHERHWISKFSDFKVAIPISAEQTAIGNFFKQLDEAIASHQRKYERMKELKQSMLQKMFPRDGEAFPELRFPNFTDAWEQRKLNQISSKVTQKNTDGVYIETFTNSAEFGIVSQRDFFDKDISNSSNLNGYYVVKHNDFVYNPRISNSAPVGPIKRNKLGRTGVMSPLYYVFRTDGIVHEFLETYFSSNHWHRFMEENGDTGARADRFAIKDKLFAQMPIPFPNHEEQNAIGNFFKQLDEAIASHQRKLEHMQTLKKGLLQQMFV
ncbi:type I restriction enzyme, S subunit [Pasteurella testudinis DSM 23072]|uniref:Type I restriction enzyme, S subunit n=1 Tax=Pasteurella testudinis DSM 23072 TaxID=1122938 RepID=A0A1W1UH34_9PAST|nr:restriction endonuclease subunit S [Pasteurella testudinis]SMB80084.1 type I restriction enzyme, S subunit [Pasteurella testudinis DSM 23072]SUB50603.1 Type I restriction modification DNA specificity domain [Pasteurella testudinis]